jgi:hypothetical protein
MAPLLHNASSRTARNSARRRSLVEGVVRPVSGKIGLFIQKSPIARYKKEIYSRYSLYK